MTAAARVAGIPELLENILLHLPLRDLFLAQRMNRTARNIIEKSTQIQQALFLRPYGPGPVTVLGAQHPVMECESKEVCEPEEWGGRYLLELPYHRQRDHPCRDQPTSSVHPRQLQELSLP